VNKTKSQTNDINWNINLKFIKKTLKNVSIRKNIITQVLWLNLLNMWFGLWQKRVQTHRSLVSTPGPLQGKAWVRMLAFKPKVTCLSFFFFSRCWWSIFKKNYINDVLSGSLDFSYHCGGWKNRTILFLLEKHNF
jgi:hypothetical protein